MHEYIFLDKTHIKIKNKYKNYNLEKCHALTSNLRVNLNNKQRKDNINVLDFTKQIKQQKTHLAKKEIPQSLIQFTMK